MYIIKENVVYPSVFLLWSIPHSPIYLFHKWFINMGQLYFNIANINQLPILTFLLLSRNADKILADY